MNLLTEPVPVPVLVPVLAFEPMFVVVLILSDSNTFFCDETIEDASLFSCNNSLILVLT